MAIDPAWEREHAQRQWGTQPEQRVIDFITDKLAPSPRLLMAVLDLGAGFGAQSFAIAEMGFSVEGIDASPSAIRRCRQRLADWPRALPHLTFSEADVTRLPFASESFDAVVDCVTLQHVSWDDGRTAVAEILRVLKAGGWFLSLAAADDYDLRIQAPHQPRLISYEQACELYASFGSLTIERTKHVSGRGRIVSWWKIEGMKPI